MTTIGLGEIATPVVITLLEKTGIFEVKPPFVLSRRKGFPNCANLLCHDKPVGPLPADCSVKYVRLCRLTALAWVVWLSAAISFAWVVLAIYYHSLVAPPVDTLEFMKNDYPLILQVGKYGFRMSCAELLYIMILSVVLAVVYYTTLLTECRAKESEVRRALKRTRRIAAAG